MKSRMSGNGDDGVEGAARGEAVDAGAVELGPVDEQVAPLCGVERLAEKTDLSFAVGRGRRAVDAKGRNECLRDGKAVQLPQRLFAEHGV